MSSIAVFELWFGVGRSTKQEFNRKRLETFLAGPNSCASVRRCRRTRRWLSARRPRSRGQIYRGLRPLTSRAGAASCETRDGQRGGVFAGEKARLARLGKAVASGMGEAEAGSYLCSPAYPSLWRTPASAFCRYCAILFFSFSENSMIFAVSSLSWSGSLPRR